MRVLYIGDERGWTTSRQRAEALRRIGHDVCILDIEALVRPSRLRTLWGRIHFKTGYRLLQSRVLRFLDRIEDRAFDLVWVNGGEVLGPRALDMIRSWRHPIILYNNDDPTGKRDSHRFDSLLDAIDRYDLCTVPRMISATELCSIGTKRILRCWMSYDEVAHQPYEREEDIPREYRSEVAFIGTWMRHEGRDGFICHLLDQGIPVAIWGERWEKSPYWRKLQPHHRGGTLSGRDYVAALQGAKICLGLLSKGNRDLHTQRSVEIPFASGLLCAERTTEHLALYREGEEAVFWSSAQECAAVCRELLADAPRRDRIREAGRRRVRQLGIGNESVCRMVISAFNRADNSAIMEMQLPPHATAS